VPRLPLLAHPEGKCGGGGTQKGGGVLQRNGGATDSSEMTESMIFVVAVLCMTQVIDISAGNGYEYDFLSVTGNKYGFGYVVKVNMDIQS
jgi:hypothetical protein